MTPTKQTYTAIAYQRMGIQAADWQPQLGFKACEAILEKLYLYYQAIYLLEPRFYWAGLARLTGGQVLYGMRNLTTISRDPSVFTQEMMAAAKDIFDNIAWQHELFLAAHGHHPTTASQTPNPEPQTLNPEPQTLNPKPQTENSKLSTPNSPTVQTLLHTCTLTDLQENHTHKYHDCWQHILSDDATLVAKGNLMLLHNEQLNTIQRHYDNIKADPYSARYCWFTRFVMRRIHPYHPRFIVQFPLGDVTSFPDRWQWITNPKGMWPGWVNLPEAERTRLVSLSNEEVVRHDW